MSILKILFWLVVAGLVLKSLLTTNEKVVDNAKQAQAMALQQQAVEQQRQEIIKKLSNPEYLKTMAAAKPEHKYFTSPEEGWAKTIKEKCEKDTENYQRDRSAYNRNLMEDSCEKAKNPNIQDFYQQLQR